MFAARQGGREHDLTFVENEGLWLKFTKFNQAGYTVDLEAQRLEMRLALPCEYFRRLGLQNYIFGDDIRFLGVQRVGPNLRIITRQPHLPGQPPTEKEMIQFLREQGFRQLNVPPMGAYESLSFIRGRLDLFDAYPRNFIKHPGGRILPVDLILKRFSTEAAAKVNLMAYRCPIQATN